MKTTKQLVAEHACEYDGIKGVSVSEEDWEDAKQVLTAGWEAGFKHLVQDDVLRLLEKLPDDLSQDVGTDSPITLESCLAWAKENNWPEED